MSRSVRRGFVVAAAASVLSAFAAGSASADVPGTGATVSDVRPVTGVTGVTGAVRAVETVAHAGRTHTEQTGVGALDDVRDDTRNGARDAGKAVGDVTQEAGASVSETAASPTRQNLGAVPGLPAPAAAPSAPGLPEDLVIEVPPLLPGVPSIGIIPLSLPELPVTPGVPVP
ncbi:hypothetical protein [Streptomyces sp. Amel2xB2]|uniref:hypothetical protein n=1 Tax=Streptomyces sp. Amel2xB2 TaxID=1305829 RepID=UPI0011B93853|nr:hypothetical protein [Streptomyces sp. Amel2xB2]